MSSLLFRVCFFFFFSLLIFLFSLYLPPLLFLLFSGLFVLQSVLYQLTAFCVCQSLNTAP